ncbi:DJ-1 family glyoxalase III [Lactobacillus sp. 3B(2020)]|uniref:DJ-1 family glyoxalase III n=1 Tax=Lactobacillus sp. 3B(2020) TaxID=2695882 RepID=UPI0015DDD35A|nr:DJ-1 family glyoxalase III [Lactobacillus sp. 3B(2020)]QLL70685.1 DJ-1 family protein [Lactobacillus sp. 3B(2020)]
MTKVAVVFADGCEEIEALTPVDVMRRLGIEVTMVGLDKLHIMGAHEIPLEMQTTISLALLDYDAVVFPGGSTGAANLRESNELMEIMRKRQANGQWNAAMCAAPLAFARYGLLDGHQFTCFPGIEKEIAHTNPTAIFSPAITVVDEAGHLITSRGPATAMAFAFKIAQVLGVATTDMQDDMLYTYLKQEI